MMSLLKLIIGTCQGIIQIIKSAELRDESGGMSVAIHIGLS